jgi:hypothetical protein
MSPAPSPRSSSATGLARLTTTAPAAEYNVQQFLGEPPPTVPAVLTAELFTSSSSPVTSND